MGLCASQARFLGITARLSDNELEQQSIAYSKQRLSENSEQINSTYLDALNKTKYQVLTGYNGTEACYEDLTYNQLTGYNSVANGKQYLVKDKSGKVLVSNEIANAFKKGNGDYNVFLKALGYTQSNLDVTNASESENAIHDAWDKYLVSIGKSIDDEKGEHILGFGYKSFSTDKDLDIDENCKATYNNAYATANDGTGMYLYEDTSGGYYSKNATVVNTYTDSLGVVHTGAFYQTDEQVGTNDYTELTNVTYDSEKKTYTYKNSDGEEKTVSTLYAKQISAGKAYVSEQQNNYLTLKSGTYTSEDGTEYNVSKSVKPLNFEGSTTAQRELYDYAVALTADYAKYQATGKSTTLKYDANINKYYENIFNEMRTCGYTTIENETKFKESNWFETQLKAGAITLSYYSSSENGFVSTTIDDDESIAQKEDNSAMKVAEQQYTTQMDKIESEEKQFDMELNKLESEHNALQTEYDSVQKVISKNVEKSFNVFNA